MSTKSGTNLLRGTELLPVPQRRADADDPFGRQPIGVGQQFGGSIGGALKKDRTFFFVAPEFQRNTKPVQILYTALDAQNLREHRGGAGRCSPSRRKRTSGRSASRSRSSAGSTTASAIATR